ncbi:MAG: hypothetical protein HXX20_17935, partial [Chloroflexi bacterium]|nr:hypothetical protein [Chloroflexota bacterium]
LDYPNCKAKVPDFEPCLNDNSSDVRSSVAYALRELGGAETVKALTLVYDNSQTGKEAREAAYEVMEHLKKKLRLPKKEE